MSTKKKVSLWSRPEPGKRESRLSRAKIAAAALAIADEEGIAAVSMRRVAAALDAGAMSLYNYVETKDELMALMDDALMAESLLPSLPKDWRRALTAIAKSTLALFIKHPWALTAMRGAPVGPNGMRHFEQCLQALASSGLSPKQKLTLLATVDDLVFGHALRASEREDDIDLDFARAQIASGAFPQLERIFANGRIGAAADRFDVGLRALLEAVSS